MLRSYKIWQASSSRSTSIIINHYRIHSTVRHYIYHSIPSISWPLLSSIDFIDDPAESSFTVVFEIPGIKTSDISLHILDGHLVVMGQRRPAYNITQDSEPSSQNTAESATQEPKLTVPIQELRYGTFRRAIPVPEDLKVCLPLACPFMQ